MAFSDTLANLVEDDLDVVIRIGNLNRSGASWIVRKLASYTRKVCASPGYLQQHGIPEHPQELSDRNCPCFSYSTGFDTWRFKQDKDVCGVKVSGSLVANNLKVLRQACLDGLGLILAPTWLVCADIRSGRLQSVLDDFQLYPDKEMIRGFMLYICQIDAIL